MDDEDDSFSEDSADQVDAYSHYRTVSKSVFKDVNHAIDGYSMLRSRRTQGVGITPQSYSKAKRAMLKITRQIGFQVKMSRRASSELQEIHDRWYGEGEDDVGYLQRLDEADLREVDLGWLGQMMDDLTEASWRLGYSQSGRIQEVHQSQEAEDEAQVSEMFD